VELPSYFPDINVNFKYQLTVVSAGQAFVQAMVSKEMSGPSFKCAPAGLESRFLGGSKQIETTAMFGPIRPPTFLTSPLQSGESIRVQSYMGCPLPWD